MSEANIVLPTLTGGQVMILWLVLVSALVALAYGFVLIRVVLAADPGPKSLTDVSDAIEIGAMAYLGRQVRTMVWFVAVIFVALFLMYRQVYEGLYLPLGISIAFLMGVAASYGAGYVGMWLAVKGNVRSANAALTSFKDAMELAFKAGGVSGMFTVGLGLLGATIIFLVFRENAMKVLVGFGFGGSLAALFMRVGGGIYTKAADVGGDLVGKIEQDLPEDDPRNPATIADNVGDNVGDCAGMAADVFESYEVTLVAAIILAAYALQESDFIAAYGQYAGMFAVKLIMFALILRGVGVFSSIIGIMAVRVPAGKMLDPMRPINIGYMTSAIASVIGFFVVNYLYLDDPRTGATDWRFACCASLGIILAVVTLWLTNYFTHPDKGPVTETAMAARTGPATLDPVGHGRGTRVVSLGAAGDCGRDHRRDGDFPRVARAAVLRNRADRPGLAYHHRLHPGDGHLRTDHRQRPRHLRDGRNPSGGSVEDAVVDGRDRQHHQGSDQGPGDCDRGARGSVAVPVVYRRGASGRDWRADQHADRVRRTDDRRRGAVPVQLVRD